VLVIQRKIYGNEHPRIAVTLQNLGVTYFDQQKPADAEDSLSKALAMQLRFRDNARGDVILTAGNLARALLQQGKRVEADQLIQTIIPPGAENQFEYFGPLCFRAQYYVQSRRLAEAALEMAAATKLKPDDGFSRLRLSCLRLLAGELAVFRRERSGMLTRFRSIRVPGVAEHIATACLLAPLAGADLMMAGELADLAAEQMPDDLGVARTKGLAQYRRGDFSGAQSWEKKALGHQRMDSASKVAAQTVVALAQLQSGETNAALGTLTAGRDARRKMPGWNPMNVFEMNWHNVLIAEILWHEAEVTFIPILQQERQSPGQSSSHLQLLADLLLSARQWDEALTLLAECAARQPEDTLLGLQLATYQTWFGKEAEHAATSRRFLEYAKGTTNAFTAERAAKAFCVRPSSDAALLAEALSVARHAVELGRDPSAMPYFQLALGVAEYRNGHLPEADKALAVAEESGKGNFRVQAPAQLFRAMSLFRQGRTNEAQRLFADPSVVFRASPSDERNPFMSGGDHDDMVTWLALKEAKALLQP
jgi:tetratricopeptide (TPR) repeat protein